MSWRLNRDCNILTPSSSVFSSTSFSFSWAAQPLLGASFLYSILSLTNWLQTSSRTGLYHCLTSTCFLWASHLHPIQSVYGQGYILMSSVGCTCFSIDGWAEGQYVTLRVPVSSSMRIPAIGQIEIFDFFLDLTLLCANKW